MMSKNTEVAFNPLYEEIETAFKFTSKPNIPKSISDNLKQKLRPYQEDALKNFIFYFKNKNYQNINNRLLAKLNISTIHTSIKIN